MTDLPPNLLLGIGFVLVLVAVVGLLPVLKNAAPYSSRALMNASEARLYVVMERWRRSKARDLTISPQVSYGAFLAAKGKPAWLRIASKRADFVIWDSDGLVRAIIEFDGKGHYGKNSRDKIAVKKRDKLKNDAARAAAIPLIRIPPTATSTQIEQTLEMVLLLSSEQVHREPQDMTPKKPKVRA